MPTEPFDLIEAVQPSSGWFAIVGIKGGNNVRQKLVATRAAAERVVKQYVDEERDVYFGVAKFKDGSSRKKPNVNALRAFWVDLDCGENKAVVSGKTGRPQGYIDQAAALTALRGFCKMVGLPRPIIVNSGRGIHAYWAMTEDLPPHVWEPAADRLRLLCDQNELWVDPVVFETARVLRFPGTLNFKQNPPLEVAVLASAEPMEFADFCAAVGAEPRVEEPQKRELSALAKSLAASTVSSFRKIMLRSGSGDGCQQLLNAYLERETISEPRWFDALSVAHFCVDRDTAIHKLSGGHPNYDAAATEEKTHHIVGPHTCEVFERNNPGGCDDCQFKGKIKSPIVLGREIVEAAENDNIVVDPTANISYTVPKYPFPFFRGVGGGVFMKPSEDEAEPARVYPYDLYVVKRMTDPLNGSVIVVRCHFPNDGVKEFTLPVTQVTEKSELRKALAWHDITVKSDKQFGMLCYYINSFIEQLREQRTAELMRTQFGWADNDSKFIIGDREISADGIFHSPPSSTTAALAEHMVPRGTLEKWREVFALYGRPGLEPNAFAALTAFGAPLLRFLGQKGMMINVIHPSSGTGKTTILHMCNSVYGDPARLCAVKEDTLNAKIMRLGVYNNLPFTVDEITNTTAADFSTLVYNMTQGRGKDRVKASSNELRLNLTSWATLSLCSSNASFYEKMATAKSTPDGESMRLIEYKIEPNDVIDTAFAKQMFDHQLMSNHGHAGDIYAGWLVRNLEEARDYVLSVQAKIDRELKLTQRERIWSAGVAANIAGGVIAKTLGLIDWDMAAIYKFATNLIRDTRQEVKPPPAEAAAVLGDYINRHMQNILVVNDGLDRRSKMQAFPTLEPRGELLIRYEPDTMLMYITTRHFKADCVATQANYKDTLVKLNKEGIFLHTANKRMSKGMKINSPAVHCLVFDCSKTQFIDVSDLEQEAAA